MALPAFNHHFPALPSPQEIQIAQESSRKLAAFTGGDDVLKLHVSDTNIEVILPASAVRLLVDILTNMSEGNAITLIPVHAELTTQQAADMLNVSRKFLIDELLEQGMIPCRKVGTHRRIPFEALMRYKQENKAKRRQVLSELATLDQELGLD
jgi:excisionase family DNA binding protein